MVLVWCSAFAYPLTPFLGGLLLNCRVILCLNFGGPLRGVVGQVTLVGLPMASPLRLLRLPMLVLVLVLITELVWFDFRMIHKYNTIQDKNKTKKTTILIPGDGARKY